MTANTTMTSKGNVLRIDLGRVSLAVAVLGALLSFAYSVFAWPHRIETVEQKVSKLETKMEAAATAHQAEREYLEAQLKVVDARLDAIQTLLGRIDERTKRSE